MFNSIGLPEILLIMVIAFIFFGAGKLPDVASGLGKAMRNFKKAQRGDFDKEEQTQLNAVSAIKSDNKKIARAPVRKTV